MKTIAILLLTASLACGQYYKAAASRDYLLVQVPDATAAYTVDPTTSPLAKGDIWTVQRDGDEAEASFTAAEIENGTLAAWVTAGGAPTDGYLKTWHDVSSTAGVANGNDATQATRANQPLVVSSGTLVTENGRPAVDFDGTSDHLATANQSVLGFGTNLSAFAVGSSADISGSAGQFLSCGENDLNKGRNALQLSESGGSVYLQLGTNGSNTGTSGPTTTTAQSIFSSVSTGLLTGESETITLGVNGSTSAGTGTTCITPVTATPIYLGTDVSAASFFDMKMQASIGYNSDQSANRTGIEGWLNTGFSVY